MRPTRRRRSGKRCPSSSDAGNHPAPRRVAGIDLGWAATHHQCGGLADPTAPLPLGFPQRCVGTHDSTGDRLIDAEFGHPDRHRERHAAAVCQRVGRLRDGVQQLVAHPLRLGTRASPLAMAQVHLVAAALKAAHGWSDGAIEIVPVTASGDKVLDRLLADIGGKALWTKELDQWLLEGRIDAAVHSMKDVETLRPDALNTIILSN